MNRDKRQIRSVPAVLETRADEEGSMTISGYFAVFNSDYEIYPGYTESIAPGAFDGQTSGDVRALCNHNTSLVLGRTKAGTLALKQDERGLWGDVTINPNDRDAVNLYERVKRGDVDQCSFGFYITDEEYEARGANEDHWTIRGVELYEVSVCTFPAYEDTNVTARMKQASDIKTRKLQAFKEKMRGKLHGTESPDAPAQN